MSSWRRDMDPFPTPVLSTSVSSPNDDFRQNGSHEREDSLRCRNFQNRPWEKCCGECPPCIVYSKRQQLLLDFADCDDHTRLQLELFVRLTARDGYLSTKAQHLLKGLRGDSKQKADLVYASSIQETLHGQESRLAEVDAWFEAADYQVQSLFLVLLLKQCANSSIVSLVPDVLRRFQKRIGELNIFLARQLTQPVEKNVQKLWI